MDTKAKEVASYDLHEMYYGRGPIVPGLGLPSHGVPHTRWVSTVITNRKYAICKGEKQKLINDPKYPRGTFFVITKNGISPLKLKKA